MDNTATVHALFDALDVGDFDRFASLFTKDAVIWHNFDSREHSLVETVEMLKGLRPGVKSARYEDRRYISVPGGAFAQHVLRVRKLDGRAAEMPIMLRLFIEDGLVQRIEEYFDLAQASSIGG